MTQMRVTVADSIADIPAAEWNETAGNDCPFLRHEFFLAAESNGDVSPESGWTPQHLVFRGDHNELRAALPLYQKDHSWGEFVFDWAWARAYEPPSLSGGETVDLVRVLMSIEHPTPEIVAAIEGAVGLRLNDLPMSPPKVLKALGEAGNGAA